MESNKKELIKLIKRDEEIFNLIHLTLFNGGTDKEYELFLKERKELLDKIIKRTSENRLKLFELIKKEFEN